MKKTLLVSSFIILFMALVAMSPALAVKPNGPSAYNGLHKGNSGVKHLELYEKKIDPVTSEWSPVEKGAWGKMGFSEDSFVFNGHKLESNTEYTLIRYEDPWPGSPVTCLGEGASNKGGNIHLSGEMKEDGPKVWLVLSDDVDCDNAIMTGWNQLEYLFEYDLIN